ncbi:MAG: hypothetical protein OEZ65_06220 [Gemmatimonadota bacterium]|nr:hypothetical protein [Gemmatimonadota bacterium]MDH5759166.1 hypothetical protein [Gemmatimonadota bacterium]
MRRRRSLRVLYLFVPVLVSAGLGLFVGSLGAQSVQDSLALPSPAEAAKEFVDGQLWPARLVAAHCPGDLWIDEVRRAVLSTPLSDYSRPRVFSALAEAWALPCQCEIHNWYRGQALTLTSPSDAMNFGAALTVGEEGRMFARELIASPDASPEVRDVIRRRLMAHPDGRRMQVELFVDAMRSGSITSDHLRRSSAGLFVSYPDEFATAVVSLAREQPDSPGLEYVLREVMFRVYDLESDDSGISPGVQMDIRAELQRIVDEIPSSSSPVGRLIEIYAAKIRNGG